MNFAEYLKVGKTADELCGKIDYLTSSGTDEYQNEARTVLGVSAWPRLPENALVEQAFAAGFADLEKRASRKKYYVANCLCFLKAIERVTTPQTKALLQRAADDQMLVKNYRGLFTDLLFDSIHILNEYRTLVENGQILFPLLKSTRLDPLPLWHFARQVVYGQVSGHAYADREPEVAVAVIRLAIEVRLRQATGILGKKAKSNPRNVQPVKLSKVIQAIADQAGSVDLPIPIQDINRIYKWANAFVHTGSRVAVLSWHPVIALDYLKPFLLGIKIEGSWDSKNGFRCSSATLGKIRDRVLELESNRPGVSGWFRRLGKRLPFWKVAPSKWELDLCQRVEAEVTAGDA